jgi:serine/threonine protein kinase
MTPAVDPLPAGDLLLEYYIGHVLGQGGFGTTYLCRDEHLQQQCVIKEFTPRWLVARTEKGDLKPHDDAAGKAFSNGLSGFLDEARKLAQFRHPNIVRVNRYFEAHGTGYFVMDYEAGGSLRDILGDIGSPLSEPEIDAIVAPLCSGLAELHRSGLLHRDIKPDNILIRSDGSPVLIDFGAVVEFSRTTKGPTTFIGTAAYAPPEQFDPHGNIGPWTDIYSMGAVMYEMIAGYHPTPARERERGGHLERASETGRGKYGDRLLGLIDHCLALETDERPTSIDECLVLLHADQDRRFREVIEKVSWKMVEHFGNWATPNNGLNAAELVAFMLAFPAIDLSWRIGKGLPDKATQERLLRSMSSDFVGRCLLHYTDRGFLAGARPLNSTFVLGRLDEYAATYLLDRKQKEWRYELTCRQLAGNCIASTHSTDVPGFVRLMEEVIDRARSRVKREFGKIYRKVEYRREGDGRVREIVDFEEEELSR